MQYGKVEICGINTSELKVLGEKEKMYLLRKAQAGDKQARDALICGNLRLVLSVIQRFSGRGESMDDLFQVGVIGLIKAIDHFNTELNVKFSTYAVPMCVGEVRRFLRDDNPVRVSRSMRDTAYKAMQVKEQLMAANGREPTVDEIAAKLGMKTTDVVLALEAIVDPVSLYEPVYSDGGDTIYVMDQVGDANTDADWVDEMMIKDTHYGRMCPIETPEGPNIGLINSIALADLLSIDRGITASALHGFTGTDRRFEYKGTIGGVTIIDDYAHHPTEIAATLHAAANYPHKTLWCVFQPHTYTRTKAFMKDFAKALSLADKVVLADIYAARETDTLGISSETLQAEIRALGHECYYFPSFDEIENFLLENCINGDLLITMGAGDVVKIGENLLGK